MDPLSTKLYAIAALPPNPDTQGIKLLSLSYTPTSGLGVFSYGNQQLQLTYTKEETTITNTFPEGKTGRTHQLAAYEIPCGVWVAYFGNWLIDEAKIYSGDRKVDRESDTGREFRDFSGFRFDAAASLWKCAWEKDNRQEVFNSTFIYEDKVMLELNLLAMVGHYGEYKYVDIAS